MFVSIQDSFHRSVNLVRDFNHPESINNYLITSKALELIGRLVTNTTMTRDIGRAWSIIGPYGGGKSSFALFLAHLLRENSAAHDKLDEADPSLYEKFNNIRQGIYCPILVVGSRDTLSIALLKGLIQGVSSFHASYARGRGNPGKKVSNCRSSLDQIIIEAQESLSSEVTDDIVIDLYQRTAHTIHSTTSGGLLLVLDELGKFLEYAALYPDQSDLYVLQSLAERASRNGVTPEEKGPMIVVTISHQSFDRYAGVMSSLQKDEWRKIQGRFEDFAFIEPVSETLQLLAKAVQIDDDSMLSEDGLTVINNLLDSTTLPPGILPSDVRDHLLKALPLHPAVSLIIGPLFRRLAQNERSLFAFLSSGEPNSFLDVFSRKKQGGNDKTNRKKIKSTRLLRYRLDHLYDYIIGSVGAALFNNNIGKLWAETESVLSRIENQNEIMVRCIKQISLLNFAGSLAGIAPTSSVLYATTDAPKEDVDLALDSLKNARLINYRSFTQEYHIWQGSDFNVDSSIEKARKKISARTPLAQLLSSVIPPAPIVARRHSFRTGTTRVFKVLYESTESWQESLEMQPHNADGQIIYILPDHDTDRDKLLAVVKELVSDALTIIGIPEGVSTLHEVVHKLTCLHWVRSHDKKLQGDAVARHEVDQQLADLTNYVEQRLMLLLAPHTVGGAPCTWIYRGQEFYPENDRSIQDKLSQICDLTFSSAPLLRNELINLHKPSASAVKGLKKLLEAMLKHENAERLNIEKYPSEYGMYASILQTSGIHRPLTDTPEVWQITQPDSQKYPEHSAVWNKILEALRQSDGRKVSVEKIYDQLRCPPYGLRDGLMPIFVVAVYISNRSEIALYENRTFIPSFEFETIERFLKSPENFQLQLVTIEGVREQLLDHLAPLVGVTKSTQKPLPIVIQLLKKIHELPPYVRRTAMLSEMALSVREVLHRAVEPTTLLFEDLPEACNVRSFLSNDDMSQHEVRKYSENLQEALRDLSGAYDNLLMTLQRQIAVVFRLHSNELSDQRHELASRAHQLLPHTSDTKLRAFLVRVTEEVLDIQGWYESIASLLAQRSPSQWRDDDCSTFTTSLREIARRFHKLEPIAFEINQVDVGANQSNMQENIDQVRLSVTTRHTEEQEQVISVHPEDQGLIDEVYQRLRDELGKDDVTIETKIVAMAKLSQELLIKRDKIINAHE
ncbi:MAG: hypothetical protein OXE59_06165 [Bacteroidetes bacterium]|nr:hypothetical protein [Bacteroidota bacterium]